MLSFKFYIFLKYTLELFQWKLDDEHSVEQGSCDFYLSIFSHHVDVCEPNRKILGIRVEDLFEDCLREVVDVMSAH